MFALETGDTSGFMILRNWRGVSARRDLLKSSLSLGAKARIRSLETAKPGTKLCSSVKLLNRGDQATVDRFVDSASLVLTAAAFDTAVSTISQIRAIASASTLVPVGRTNTRRHSFSV